MIWYCIEEKLGADQVLDIGSIWAFEGYVCSDLNGGLLCDSKEALNLYIVSLESLSISH